MAPLLASALLSLAQGPYSPALENDAPADAPVWIAGQAVKEHWFTVTAKYQCPPDTVGGLLLVSISDTTVRAEFGADDRAGRRVLSLQVPSGQLRGLRPELFCPAPEENPGPVMRLKSRFIAQGALVCRNANDRKTSAQTSVALDAWVRCPPIPALNPGNEGVPPSTRAGRPRSQLSN